MIEGVNPGTPTWRALSRYIDQRIGQLSLQLEQPFDPEQTAALRGRIAELRAMKAQAEPDDEPEDTGRGEPPLY